MTNEKEIIVFGKAGLDDFLKNANMYDYCDAVVAIFDPLGEIRYANAAYNKIHSNLDITSQFPQLEDAFSAESLSEYIGKCVSDACQSYVQVKLYLSLNISTNITLKLTPICDKQTNNVLSVMLNIAEENIAFGDFSFIQQQINFSDLKKQIESLSKSTEQQSYLLRALLHETPFAIMLVDHKRKIVQANRTAGELLQVDVRNIIGHSCDIYLDCFYCHGECPLQDSRNDLIHNEGIAYCADGTQRNILRSTVNLKEKNNDLFIEAFIDITDRKHAEAELEMHRNNLEQLVIERTREMELARQESDRANNAKSEFLLRMAHELRTPLNSVIGYAQLLELSMQPETENHKQTQFIVEAGRHILSIINELLNLSQIESGTIDFNFEDVLAAEVVRESMHYIEVQAAMRGISLELNGVDKQIKIRIDRTRFKEILINILNNAVKYNSDEGFIKVNLFADDKYGVCVDILDSGVGIAPDNISKLFEPFERLEAANTDIEGTGIGLSIVKSLVNLMNGNLFIESTVGKGTLFRVCFSEK